MQNINKIPHFKYHFTNPLNTHPFSMHCGSIEADGEVIHKIEDRDLFYKEFGYTSDMQKAGVLPDEFIWAEYIQNTTFNFVVCIQMHIIEYLKKHSDTFRRKYGDQCESWLADHAKEAAVTGYSCTACRMKQLCETYK